MDEKEKERLSLAIYDVVWSMKNTLSFPVHDTLYKSFLYSLLMFGIIIIAKLLKVYTFLSWQGCLICALVLGILLWVERAQNNAYERTLEQARRALKEAKKKARKMASKGGK